MFNGKKVLIVEDSYTVRYEVKLILEKTGISLAEAANEIGMYNMMEEYGKCVDMIIMDVTLKSENGLDLVKKLKDSERYGKIPVLMLSEHSGLDYVLKAKELGVAGYLKKPIQKDELISRVKKILGENEGDG